MEGSRGLAHVVAEVVQELRGLLTAQPGDPEAVGAREQRLPSKTFLRPSKSAPLKNVRLRANTSRAKFDNHFF